MGQERRRRRVRPFVAAVANQGVEQWCQRCAGGQRDDRRARLEQPELERGRCARHDRAEQQAAGGRIRRRARIGDHEEREQEQRAVPELVQRDREGVAEPDRAAGDDERVGYEERKRGFSATCPRQHEHAERNQRQAAERRAAPLARRDPGVVARDEHGRDAEGGRVEDVLAADAQQELAADREPGGGDGQRRRVRAKQEAKRQRRDQRTQRVEAAGVQQARQQPLRAQRRDEDRGDVAQACADAEFECTEREQRAEREDLVAARVAQTTADTCKRFPQRVHAAC